jgi:hypothetical protein
MPDLKTMSNHRVLAYYDNLANIHERHFHKGETTVWGGICQTEGCGWEVDARLRISVVIARISP